MKHILFYFRQVGGANALMPLIKELEPKYNISIAGGNIVKNNLQQKGIKIYDHSDMGIKKGSKICAKWMDEVLSDHENEETQKRVLAEVRELCKGFPVPGIEI